VAVGRMRYTLGWDESCRLVGGIDSFKLDGQRTATGWWERWTPVSWEEGWTAVSCMGGGMDSCKLERGIDCCKLGGGMDSC
jgi:hypothetical protein